MGALASNVRGDSPNSSSHDRPSSEARGGVRGLTGEDVSGVLSPELPQPRVTR